MGKKNVLITGSSIGLGSSLARIYAKNNYNVIVNYVSHENEAEELVNELKNKYNSDSICIKCDISNENEIENMYESIMNKYGSLDILINNASISKDSLISDKTKESFMKILEVNTVGTFLVSRIFGDLMYKQEYGSIINIASTNGLDTYYEYSLDYDASKSAVINLTHNLANHYSPFVRVNAICPGWINTPMNKDMDIEFKQNEEKKILLNRFAEPEEIASAIYKISEESYINDSIIRIDGGVRHE